VNIPSEVSCKACRVTITRLGTFGEDDRTQLGFIGTGAASIARSDDGTLYFGMLSASRPELYVFEPSGKLARMVGRAGDGPGEFRLIRSIALGNTDTLFVFDQTRRVSVFAPNGTLVRSGNVPLVVEQAVVFSNGSIVGMGSRATPEHVGLPLHLIDARGESIRAFGDTRPIVDPQAPVSNRRVIAPSGSSGTVWSARIREYLIERWDTAGTLQQIVRRQADWFPPPPVNIRVPPPVNREQKAFRVTEPRPSAIAGLQEDNAGLLWVNAIVAGEDWKSHGVMLGEGHPMTPKVHDQLYDSVIEVIDVRSRRVVAALRVPFYNAGFVGRGVIASVRETESGARVIDLWRLALIR
jgi:hypothetical protein